MIYDLVAKTGLRHILQKEEICLCLCW